MPRTLRRLLLGIAATAIVAGGLAATTPLADPLTKYCNDKRGKLESSMVKNQCKCSLKRVLNPNYDLNSCLNQVPSGVVPKFVSSVGKVYDKVRAVFASSYPNPSCQD